MFLIGDIGRTTCRLARFEHGRRRATTEVASGVSLADPNGVAGTLDAIESGVSALGDLPGLAGVCIGVTGAGQSPPATAELTDALERRFGTPVTVASDVVTAHAGAFAGGPGVLTIAGTGAVALAVAPDGSARMVDGWGHLLGDAGSGAAVGRAGLAAALRAHDGRRGGSVALARAATSQFGDLDDVARTVQGASHPVRVVAGFAQTVADCARDGDSVSAAIWRDAARELADTTIAACRGLPDTAPVAVTFLGSLFDLDDLVAAPVRDAVATARADVDLRPPAGDALEGAYRLVAAPLGLHAQLIPPVASARRSRTEPNTMAGTASREHPKQGA